MSAIPSQQLELQRQWVTVAQLAVMTGKSKRTLQWSCMNGDLRNCHKWEARDGGGPAVLKIDLLHAPEEYRLAWISKQREEAGTAIAKLTDKQRRKAAAMASVIEEVAAHLTAPSDSRYTEKERIESFLAHRRLTDPLTPSIRTYYRARERWLAGGKSIASLADQRAMPGKGVKVEIDEEVFKLYASLWLDDTQKSAVDCYEQTEAFAHDNHLPIPSLQTMKREMDRRVSVSKQKELREGKEARRNRCDPYINRDFTPLASNEFWVSDHCQFDIIALDDLPGHELAKDGSFKPARMWVVTWMDERSRYVTGWRIHRGPNSSEVMASFVDAVEACGIPENVRIDNGKDYRCQRFAGGRDWREEIARVQLDESEIRPMLIDLRCTPHYTDPHNARGKIVEPWHHHWVHMKFDRSFPGYCGSTPQDRPESLTGYNGKGGLIKSGGLMKWSEIVPVYAEMIRAYHMDTHGELGMCPALCRQQTLLNMRTATRRRLSLLLQDKKKVMIGQNGVELNGFFFGLGNMDVIRRQGEYVRAQWDRQKMGVIYLYDLDGRFICEADNDGLLSAKATHEDFVAVKKLHKRNRQLKEELDNMMPVLRSVSPVEQMALRRRAAEIENGPLPEAEPVPLKPLEFEQGSWGNNESILQFRPVSPAPDGSKVIRTQVVQGTDSPESQDAEVAGKVLPTNILDAFSAG